MRRHRPICIVHAFHPEIKSSRDVHSGILRYAQGHPDLQIRSVRPGSYYATHAGSYPEARQQLRDLHPDGVVTYSVLLAPDPGEPPMPKSIQYACVNEYMDSVKPANPRWITGYLDDRTIIHAAVDLALRRQHRNFAYVDTLNPKERPRSVTRARLYAEELAASGHALRRFCQEPSSSFDEDLQSLGAWLQDLPKPCMVFAYADERARDVIDACHLTRLAIPDQINVIGIDNDAEICELVEPKLTSIQPDFELCGYLAAQALHRRILSPRVPRRGTTFTYGVKAVIERASTRDLRGGGAICAAEDGLSSAPRNSSAGLSRTSRSAHPGLPEISMSPDSFWTCASVKSQVERSMTRSSASASKRRANSSRRTGDSRLPRSCTHAVTTTPTPSARPSKPGRDAYQRSIDVSDAYFFAFMPPSGVIFAFIEPPRNPRWPCPRRDVRIADKIADAKHLLKI